VRTPEAGRTAKQSIWFMTAAHPQTGVDFQPLSVPLEIEPVGRISGKGV
jgi:hypothetical protein